MHAPQDRQGQQSKPLKVKKQRDFDLRHRQEAAHQERRGAIVQEMGFPYTNPHFHLDIGAENGGPGGMPKYPQQPPSPYAHFRLEDRMTAQPFVEQEEDIDALREMNRKTHPHPLKSNPVIGFQPPRYDTPSPQEGGTKPFPLYIDPSGYPSPKTIPQQALFSPGQSVTGGGQSSSGANLAALKTELPIRSKHIVIADGSNSKPSVSQGSDAAVHGASMKPVTNTATYSILRRPQQENDTASDASSHTLSGNEEVVVAEENQDQGGKKGKSEDAVREPAGHDSEPDIQSLPEVEVAHVEPSNSLEKPDAPQIPTDVKNIQSDKKGSAASSSSGDHKDTKSRPANQSHQKKPSQGASPRLNIMKDEQGPGTSPKVSLQDDYDTAFPPLSGCVDDNQGGKKDGPKPARTSSTANKSSPIKDKSSPKPQTDLKEQAGKDISTTGENVADNVSKEITPDVKSDSEKKQTSKNKGEPSDESVSQQKVDTPADTTSVASATETAVPTDAQPGAKSDAKDTPKPTKQVGRKGNEKTATNTEKDDAPDKSKRKKSKRKNTVSATPPAPQETRGRMLSLTADDDYSPQPGSMDNLVPGLAPTIPAAWGSNSPSAIREPARPAAASNKPKVASGSAPAKAAAAAHPETLREGEERKGG